MADVTVTDADREAGRDAANAWLAGDSPLALGAIITHAIARARAEGAASERERLEVWAEFGSWAFDSYWSDGEPGDVDWADTQEKALALGLLTRRTEAQATYSCAEGCEWEAGKPFDECECLFPTRGTIRARGEQADAKGGA